MTEAMQVGAFVAQLAAKQPTPGGGAAACVAAAIGNAAGAMACAYSQRKKDVESGAAAVAAETGSRLLAAGPRELSAADEDAAAYGALQATWAKDCALSNEAKAAVAAHALAVPVGLVERCHEHALLLKTFFPSCNPGIVSDAHVGVHLLCGAARAAFATVMVNSPPPFEATRLRGLLAELRTLEDAILFPPAE
mmetsp:Transcript_6702/g.21641  ORF Transcript_6702/g.21641 Transcript_6702/m.21641 type:complete len:194 (-) Transcript_6702:114-695(-)